MNGLILLNSEPAVRCVIYQSIFSEYFLCLKLEKQSPPTQTEPLQNIQNFNRNQRTSFLCNLLRIFTLIRLIFIKSLLNLLPISHDYISIDIGVNQVIILVPPDGPLYSNQKVFLCLNKKLILVIEWVLPKFRSLSTICLANSILIWLLVFLWIFLWLVTRFARRVEGISLVDPNNVFSASVAPLTEQFSAKLQSLDLAAAPQHNQWGWFCEQIHSQNVENVIDVGEFMFLVKGLWGTDCSLWPVNYGLFEG